MNTYPDLSPRLWPPTQEQLAFWQDQTGRKDGYEKAYAQWVQEKCTGAVYEKNDASGFADTRCALLNGLLALSTQSVHQYRLIISTPPDPEHLLLHHAMDVIREQFTWVLPPGTSSWDQALRDKVSRLQAAPLKVSAPEGNPWRNRRRAVVDERTPSRSSRVAGRAVEIPC